MKKRTIGSLTHADFGRRIEVAGHAYGVLWSIQHVAAIGDIPEPWTRVTVRREQGHSESTRGLPPGTAVTVHELEATCQTCGSGNNGCGVATEAVAGGATTRWLCRMTEAAR